MGGAGTEDMAKASKKRKPASSPAKGRDKKAGRRAPSKAAVPSHFVGRAGSPVLDKYPPKDPSLLVRGPPKPSAPGGAPRPPAAHPTPPAPATSLNAPLGAPVSPAPPAPIAAATPLSAKPLLTLEKPFDPDEFAQLLGETNIRVTVPREELAEVLRRVCDFMGFGIYVYSIQVRPARSEMLKEFVIDLTRVDYSAPKGDWVTFQEQGRSESPFGPGERR